MTGNGIPQVLALDRKSRTYATLAGAIRSAWKSRATLPRIMSVCKNTAEEFVIRIAKGSFSIEYNAVAIPPLPTFKLLRPFLVPPNLVTAVELRCTARSFDMRAICTARRTVSLEEARRLSRKRALPPGIHGAAALSLTGRVRGHAVQGGLPSLGKRR